MKLVSKTEKVSSTVIEKTKSLNYQRGWLECNTEDEESQLPERKRNLGITPSDAERLGKLPEKLKSYHDDQTEHLRGGGYRCGVSM